MTTAVCPPLPARAVERECADILLIDDNDAVRLVLATALRKAGYSVQAAPEGKTALRLLSSHRFRLVITDIFMPEVDGLEVIMKSVAHGRETPILAISGGGGIGGPDCVLKPAGFLGCRKTLAKPFELPEFLTVVADLLRTA